MGRTWMILAALAALLALAPAANADEFAVNSVADAGGECTVNECTIRQALGAAAALPGPDVVTIPAGTYTLTLGALDVRSDVTLRASDTRKTTIVASANARAVEITNATASLTNLTLSGGTATGVPGNGFHGGTLLSQTSTVTLDSVRVTGGSAFSGGGVANRNGTMLIRNSLIDRNTAFQGGGDGGGIINFGGDGGSAAALTIQNSTIAFNSANLAGALISYGSPQDSVTLEGVTIARNSAGFRGTGGISFGPDAGVITARSTIVAANDAQGLPSNCGGGVPLASQGWNVESGTECGFTQEVDVHGVDALVGAELGPAGGQTDVLLLSPLSPAVNLNGNLTACGGIDQRGEKRPKGPRCDAGAVEIDYAIRIDGGRAGTGTSPNADFVFSSTSGVAFDCALDRPGGPAGEFGPCPGAAGTASYADLKPGAYTFRVRALVDDKPVGEAPRAFTVAVLEPDTTIDSGPVDFSPRQARFTFSSDDPAATFECMLLPNDAWVPCTSPWTSEPLEDGVSYVFRVRARNAAGTYDGKPAERAFVADMAAPVVMITSGPPAISNETSAVFEFTSEAGATFECTHVLPGGSSSTVECQSGWNPSNFADGVHEFRIDATDRAGNVGSAARTVTVDTVAPVVTITSGPPAISNESFAVFEFTSEPGARFECTHMFPDGASDTISCESGWHPYDFIDGVHGFRIDAIDPAGNVGSASRTVTVDTIAPTAEVSQSGTTFTFAPSESGAVFECRIEGQGDFAPCTSPVAYDSLAPGEYTFMVRTVDAAGNRSEPVARTFSVAAAPAATPTPSPEPVATPRPVATPTPTPQAGETVVARAVSGRILVKRPNSSEFVELRGTDSIPVGAEVNAKNGRVALTIEPGNGKPTQRAVFYAGIFRISQPGATLDLTLSEPLAACKKRARSAQSKPKTRKLWGDGKGKFRTKGRYSAATVRGTIWLVQDSCDGTLTRVRQGVVSVRDSARGRTVLVRAGRSYQAKPRRR